MTQRKKVAAHEAPESTTTLTEAPAKINTKGLLEQIEQLTDPDVWTCKTRTEGIGGCPLKGKDQCPLYSDSPTPFHRPIQMKRSKAENLER